MKPNNRNHERESKEKKMDPNARSSHAADSFFKKEGPRQAKREALIAGSSEPASDHPLQDHQDAPHSGPK